MATRSTSFPKEKRRNSEKRKEKSRVAARNRRGMECEIFTQLTDELPLPSNMCNQLDKASIMRVAIAYIKIRHLLNQMNLTNLTLEKKTDKLLTKALEGFLLIISEDGEIIYLSENVTQYLGLTQVDLVGQSVFDYTHPCDHDEIRETLILKSSGKEKNSTDTARSLFIRMKCTITEKGRSVNMKSASYKVIHFTGQVISEKPEKKSNCTKTNTLIPSLGNCMVAIGEPIAHPSDIEVPLDKQTFLSRHNLDMSFTYVDDRVNEILGYSSDDLIDKKLYQFHHAQDAEAVDKFYKILFAKGQCETGCYRFLAKRGGYVWVLTQATIIYGGKAKKPLCIVCVNYILSGLENADEIVSIEQTPACLAKEHTQSSEDNRTESTPLNTTNTIFAPRTKDMNKGFLTFIDDESGYTVLNDEPDDLTHLAPTSGDVCIPLDVPIFSNDMFEDVLFTDSFCDSDMMTDLSCIGEDALHTQTTIPLTNDPLLSFRADRVSSTDSDDVPNLCSKQNSPGDLESADLISSDSEKSKYNDSSGSVDRLMFLGMKVESTSVLSDKSDVDLEGDEFDLRAPYIPIGVGEDLPLLTPSENLWNSSTDSQGLQSQHKHVSADSTITNSSIVTSKSSLAKLLQSALPLKSNSGKCSERNYYLSLDVRYKSQFDGGGTIKSMFSKNETFAQNDEDNLCKQSQKRSRALSNTKKMVNKRAKMDISMDQTETEDVKQNKSDNEKTTSFKNSVLLNLLVSGHDVSHGYSCYTDKGEVKKNMMKKSDNGMQSREIRFRDSNCAASLITPDGLIPNLLDITQLDMEVNAPVYKSQDLLQGQELLNALDSTLVTNDSYI